jgi:hypothetical protein
MFKYQAPGTKFQINFNYQMRKIKQVQINKFSCLEIRSLEFGAYLEFGACNLEFSKLPRFAA